MIRSLPIFKSPPSSPLDSAQRLLADGDCSRCAHSGGKSATCVAHQGQVGGLLIVDSYPTIVEARGKRHLASTLGAKLRQLAERSGQPVAYAHALRCAPKGGASAESATLLVPGLTECLPYLAHTLEAVRPTRIIALGAPAIYSLTGASVTPSTTRGGFSWLKLSHGWVPVFYGISPAAAGRNKFLEAWLLEDFPAMLTQEPLTPPPEVGETWAKLVVAEASAEQCLEEMKTSRWTAVDCEWAGRPYDKDFKLLSLAMTPAPISAPVLAWDKGEPALHAWVWTQEALKNPACVALLKAWLRDSTQKKVGSYFKSDTVALHAALGIWTRGVTSDTRLLRKLMDAEASGRLADMAHLVGRGGHKDELKEAMQKAVGDYKRARAKDGLFKVPLPGMAEQAHADKIMAGAETEQYGFAFVDPELLYRYNAADTVVTSLVGGLLERRLAKEPAGMQQVAKLTVIPASDTYARVESWGLRVDKDALQTLGQYLDVQIRDVEDRLAQYGYDRNDPKAGKFMPGSPQSLGKFLFGELGLKSTRITDTGKPATDAEALEELKEQHPVVNDILSWRGLSKMKASYVENMLGYIRDDGRVHPSIHPDGARTGRTSSSNPNLQVMPSVESTDAVQAELARMFRDCFAPPAGYALLEVDYSQLELRVAADLSGDPAMLDIFKDGKDFHMQTARLLAKTLWGIESDQITDTHRREAKPYVFTLIYDDDPYGMAMRMGITKEKAAQIKDAVFGCYPLLGKWIKERVAETSRTGAAWTWWAGMPARRRPLIDVANLEAPAGKTQRRSSWNTPIQGTGNEYLVASAIEVVDWLVSDGIPAKLLVTIHDSMLLEVRNDCMSEVRDRVLEIMTSHRTKNGVPLAADAKCGPTWARMSKWKAGQPCPLEGCR